MANRRRTLRSAFSLVPVLRACAGIAVLTAGFAPAAHAQYAADGYAPAIVGRIHVITVQPDGKALVGGEMNDSNCRKLCRLLADGRFDATFTAAQIDDAVDTIAVQPDGKVLVGGSFANVGGQPRQRIARLNANGSLDGSFAAPVLTGAYGISVRAVSVQADGKVLMGGMFDTVGGQAHRGVARLDANGTLDSSFVDPQLNDYVATLVRQADGKLLLGGSFTAAGGHAGSVVRLNAGGKLDTAFVAPVVNGISRLAVQADGKLLVGGVFTQVGAQARSHLARLNANGSLDAGYADPGIDGSVTSLIVQPDGRVLIGGLFIAVGGQERHYLARLDANGALDSRFTDPRVNNWVGALALQPDGNILLSGDINRIGDQPHGRLARLTANGHLDTTFAANGGANAEVFALAQQSDDKVLIGGSFTTFDGNARKGIARLADDGSLDTGFVNPNADGEVFSLALWDDAVLVGGNFTTLRGQQRHSVGRLMASNGAIDSGFADPMVGGAVYGLDVTADGKVLIGGDFTTVNGHQRRHAARLDIDGSLDEGFGDPRLDGAVLSLATQPDGKVLLGGAFTSVLTATTPAQSVSRRGVLRLHADGSLDASFDDPHVTGGTGTYDCVMALALLPDGKVLVGGAFDTVGGQPRKYLARLGADGHPDMSFPDLHLDGMVTSLLVQADGKMLFAGAFTTAGGIARNGIARLNVDGSLDTGFVDPYADGAVYAIALQTDGKLLAGGSFQSVSSMPRNRVARLSLTDAALQSLEMQGDTVTWRRGGTAPELAAPPQLSPYGAMTRIAGGWRMQLPYLPPQFDAGVLVTGSMAGGAHNASHSPIEGELRVWRGDAIFADGFD